MFLPLLIVEFFFFDSPMMKEELLLAIEEFLNMSYALLMSFPFLH